MSHDAPKNFKELFDKVTAPIREFMDEDLPEGVNFFQTTGSLCAFMAMLQIVTGILMAFYYVPSPMVAWESVHYVETEINFGKIIHGLHHWGSSGFVVALFIHMLRVFTFGAYKGMRRWTWVVGVGLMMVVLGFGFTGYLLPWDMKAYFGTVVGTNIMGKVPVVGEYLRRFLLGGPVIGEQTIPRFYALHVLILPGALIALIAAHLYLVRLFGITPPWKRDDEPVVHGTKFFPTQALRDSIMIFGALSILLVLAWRGETLEPKANPLDTAYAPHPEWYFLGLQQLLTYFQGGAEVFGTTVIPAAVTFLLLMLPFYDRNPERSLRKRPIAVVCGVLAVVVVSTLTIKGYVQLQHERVILAKIAQEDAANADKEAEPATAKATPAETPATAAEPAAAVPAQLAAAGAELYSAFDCARCHASEKSGKELNIPPTLDYAGDRFTSEWLKNYMKTVPPRRFDAKNKPTRHRMPDFKLSDADNDALVAHLGTMSKPEHFEGVPAEFKQSTPEKIARGEEHYGTEACGVCHKLNGKGTNNAPDLTGVGSRLHPRFIFAMIKHAQKFVPDCTMEDSFLGDPEIEDLTYYLMEQK